MDRDSENKIIESVERILAGEEIRADAKLDEDARKDVEFARRLASIGQAPTAEFQSQLRAKLVHDLVEQEEKASNSQPGFWNFLRKPVWQAAASALLVILIAGGVLLATNFLRPYGAGTQAPEHSQIVQSTTTDKGVASPPVAATRPTTTAAATTAAPTTTRAPAAGAVASLAASATTDKASYGSGEGVTFTVTVTNTSGQPVTLSNFPPILSVMQASSGRAVYTFPLGQTQVTLAPDQQKQFAETWSQTNTTGGAAPAGSYYIELEDLQLQGQPVKLMLTQPARFDIISADSTAGGGVLKTITVNKSQAAGGAMVTLQRVDLTSTGFRVYAFAVSLPGYSPTDPPGKYQVSGTYYVDNGWGNDAGMCGALVKADGVYLTWQIKSGLPQDAAKLTFAFRLGGADWLFDVPLR